MFVIALYARPGVGPQTLEWWYLVAILTLSLAHDFVWPPEVEPITLSALLGPHPAEASSSRRPGGPTRLATRNVDREIALLLAEGHSLDTRHAALDSKFLRPGVAEARPYVLA